MNYNYEKNLKIANSTINIFNKRENYKKANPPINIS